MVLTSLKVPFDMMDHILLFEEHKIGLTKKANEYRMDDAIIINMVSYRPFL